MGRIALYTLLLCSLGLVNAPAQEKEAPAKPLRVFFLSCQSNRVGSGQEWYLKKERPELLKPRNDAFGIQWGHPSEGE